MNDMKRDLIRIQELVGMAFSETGSLVALTDGGQMNPNKLQKTLEQTMEQFERTTLELRRLCERYSPGAGGFAHRPALPYMDITGSVETFGYGWLHITLLFRTMVLNAKARIGGRHPTDTCTNPIFSGACSTAADLLGDKAAKSIETACNFIRRRQQKVHTYLPTMRG